MVLISGTEHLLILALDTNRGINIHSAFFFLQCTICQSRKSRVFASAKYSRFTKIEKNSSLQFLVCASCLIVAKRLAPARSSSSRAVLSLPWGRLQSAGGCLPLKDQHGFAPWPHGNSGHLAVLPVSATKQQSASTKVQKWKQGFLGC